MKAMATEARGGWSYCIRSQKADREGAGPQDFKSRPSGLLPPVGFQPLKVPQPSKAVPPARD